jgi:hypothetical protein
MKNSLFILCLSSLSIITASAQQQILMFVSHEQTYYSEYVVMRQALEAKGYLVDVRSASPMPASIYMDPYADIPAAANNLSGSSYSQFQAQYSALFGQSWNESLNEIPATVPVSGSLLDIDMNTYAGLVVVGGLGALDYRVDGAYLAQGSGGREINASVIEQVANKLNQLALDALVNGKPVMAQCHSASLPAFWRIPGTSGPGTESLGYSLLKGGRATGFPEPDTPSTLESLDIIYMGDPFNLNIADRLTISSPHESLAGHESGKNKIITTRDWYPQTVAYAAKAFMNILETYPATNQMTQDVSVLVIHGGAVDIDNCGAGNKNNDVPCNYGNSPAELPADYTHLMALFSANSADGLSFQVDDLNLDSNNPSYSNMQAMLDLFSGYDVVVFFKHWSTYLTNEMQQALVNYAEGGGGVVSIHHGLYNDNHSGQTKDILVNELFGAQSSPSGWSASRINYQVYNTNAGHFISSFGIDYNVASSYPGAWSGNALTPYANQSYSSLPSLNVYDELYNNMTFTGAFGFGNAVGDIIPIFSNNQSGSLAHTTAFARLVNENGDDLMGRAFYLQVGERLENFEVSSAMGQVIRNATKWTASSAPPANGKLDQYITFDALDARTFGDAPFEVEASSTSGLHVVFESSNTSVATISGTTVTIVGAGSTTITASQMGDDNYNTASSVQRSLTVNKANQSISFSTLTDRTYGDASFSLNASATSTLPISFEVVSGPASLSGTVLTITGAGTVTVRANQAGNQNYLEATPVERSFSVTKATLTATGENKSKTYGASNPNLTIHYDGFIGTDNINSLQNAPIANVAVVPTSVVGTYPITVSGGASSNYDFNYINGALTINKATLTVSADNKSITYGDPMPTLTMQFAGFVNGENVEVLTSLPEANTEATTASNSGEYEIMVSGGESDNYDFTRINGTLSIQKASLTVTAENKSITYGDNVPELTLIYDGFVLSENIDALTNVPIASTQATSVSDAGAYPITVSGGMATNYNFSYVNGTLNIGKASAQIELSNLEQERDGSPKSPSVTTNPTGLNYTLTFDGSQGAPSAIGTYEVVATIVETNYEGMTNGTFVITGIPLAIGKDWQLKVYPNPASDYFIVDSPDTLMVFVFDTAGKLLLKSDTEQPVNISSLPSGIYFMTLQDVDGHTKHFKIVKD